MRTETGKIISIHGKGNIMIGELGDTNKILPLVQKAFDNKYKASYQKDIDAWLKAHYVYVSAMNATHYINDGNMKKVSKSKQTLLDMIKATDEGFSVLEKIGYDIVPAFQRKFVREYKWINYYFNKVYHKLPMNKVVKGSDDEIYALLQAFKELKKEANISTPTWDRLENEFMEKYLVENE